VFAFYVVLFLAGSNDILASLLRTAPEAITNAFRIMVIVLPLAVFAVTMRVCRELRRRTRRAPGPPVHRIVRTPDGGYRAVNDRPDGDGPAAPPPHNRPPLSGAGEHPESPVKG
jgi:ubiquinol-cytochrome c reductase cytochrome b subunit